MKIPDVPFENNDQAAHKIDSEIRPVGLDSKRLTLRPFNRFDPAFTEWWFVPSTKWPAYEFGKLVVRRYPRSSDGLMYCGYHVEKGYHPKLSNLEFVSSSEIVQPKWYWHQFILEGREGMVDTLVRHTAEASKMKVRLLVEGYPLKPGDSERPLPGSGDAVELAYRPEDEGYHNLKSSQDVLSKLNSAQSVKEGLEELQSIPDLDFYWIDLTIAIAFSYSSQKHNVLGPERIWQLSMEPWLRWVK